MNNIKKVIKFDIFTIKPYFTIKNIIIFILMGFFIVYNAKSGIAIGGVVMVMGSIYISYPFAISEQNGFESLPISLGLSRREIVIGRYCWAFIIYLACLLISIIAPIIINYLIGFQLELSEVIFSAVTLFIIFTLISMVQFPIYFKLGYTKSRFLSFIPFLFIFAFIFVIGSLKDTKIDVLFSNLTSLNIFILIALTLIVYIVVVSLSIKKSIKLYKAREIL